MSKRKLAGLICVFAAVVLIVLAFALPIYKTASRVQDYNGKDAVIAASDGFLFYAYGKTEALSHFRGKDLFSDNELQNRVARAYCSSAGSLLTSENLVLSLERQEADASGGTPSLPDAGEGAIVAALTICNGDVDAAAERLGVSRATLYRRMKKYGIVPRLLKQRP